MAKILSSTDVAKLKQIVNEELEKELSAITKDATKTSSGLYYIILKVPY